MQKSLKILTCLFILTCVNACTPVVSQRGNTLEEHQLTQVVAGEHTKSDVLYILGSPTTQSTFNTNVWYYLGQETQKKGILDDEVVEESIIALTFNSEGIVEKIENITPDRENIPYARGKTPTHGNELTFMQQLLGNVGRFNAPEQSAARTAGGGI